jgi:hypothetical protein
MGASGCLVGLLLLPSFILLSLGSIYVFRIDLAWRWTERFLKTVKPQRTPDWERYATINGVFMLLAGLAMAVLVMMRLRLAGW